MLQLIGDSAVLPTTEKCVSGEAYAFRFEATSTGLLEELELLTAKDAQGATAVEIGIYADSGGEPGELLGKGTFVGKPGEGEWIKATGLSVELVSGVAYWLAFLSHGGTLFFLMQTLSGGSPTDVLVGQAELKKAKWGVLEGQGPVSVRGMGELIRRNVGLQNFLGIVNEVLNFGFNDGPQVNRGRIEAWVNEAHYQIARQVEAPEFQEAYTYNTETGVWEYPLPADFLRVQDIWYPEQEMRLRPVDLQNFNMTNPQVVAGSPAIYTLYKNMLLVFPAPQSNGEELVMHYIKEPRALVNQTDIPILNPNYWHLLIDYAVCRAFEAEDDYEASQQFQGRFQRDLAAYATDVQARSNDRPRVIDGTWTPNRANYGTRAY
jgi:hypothetical protein